MSHRRTSGPRSPSALPKVNARKLAACRVHTGRSAVVSQRSSTGTRFESERREMGFSLFLPKARTIRVGKVPPRAIEKGATVRVSVILLRNTGENTRTKCAGASKECAESGHLSRRNNAVTSPTTSASVPFRSIWGREKPSANGWTTSVLPSTLQRATR